MKEAILKFIDPRLLVSLIVISFYGWAFYQNPKDQTLIGALISAFNIAVGYYLGSARSADEANRANRNSLETMTANLTGNDKT